MIDAFVFEPFSVNAPLIDWFLLLESQASEVWLLAGSASSRPGSGTIDDPYIISSAQDFDELLDLLAPYAKINLGPGVYLTQGHSQGLTTGWRPKSGQRIVGSGVDISVIRLAVSSPQAGAIYFGVGIDDSKPISDFEMTDLTIDCQQSATAHSSIATGAVKAYGSHIFLQRIRAFDFG